LLDTLSKPDDTPLVAAVISRKKVLINENLKISKT
jgi:hypothetical protein